MTTRNLPPLDRLIEREVTTSGAVQSASHTFAHGATTISGQTLTLPLTDEDGATVTPPAVGAVLNLDGRNSFNSPASAMITVAALTVDTEIEITFTGSIGTIASGRSLTVGYMVQPEVISTVKVWAGRRDFPAGDFVDSTTSGLVNINDSRYIVRAESGPWAAGDRLTDDDGNARTVQGVSQLDRRFLEILARRTG